MSASGQPNSGGKKKPPQHMNMMSFLQKRPNPGASQQQSQSQTQQQQNQNQGTKRFKVDNTNQPQQLRPWTSGSQMNLNQQKQQQQNQQAYPSQFQNQQQKLPPSMFWGQQSFNNGSQQQNQQQQQQKKPETSWSNTAFGRMFMGKDKNKSTQWGQTQSSSSSSSSAAGSKANPSWTQTQQDPSSAAPVKKQRTMQWTEKYRPKSIDAVAGQKQAVELLKASCTDNEFPNFLFYGPPGVGKTTAALAFCRSIFKNDFERRVLELNASDERGINAIRERVKRFSQLAVGSGPNASSNKGQGSQLSIKVVILDEADQMTKDAQSCLRRIMEVCIKTTRFIILCNYVSKIIDPIHSRCMKFEFQPLATIDQKNNLNKIIVAEKIKIKEDALLTLIKLTKGDLRKSVTMLQMAHSIYNNCQRKVITEQHFFDLYQRVPTGKLMRLIELASDNSAADCALKLDQFVVKELISQGHSIQKILHDLFDFVNEIGTYAKQEQANGDDLDLDALLNLRDEIDLCPMKIVYIGKCISDANENVTVFKGDESIQLRHLCYQLREVLTVKGDFPVPQPANLSKYMPANLELI